MSTNIPRLAREAIELSEKATPGPWRTFTGATFQELPMVCSVKCEIYVLSKDKPGEFDAFPNQALIAHAGTHYGTLARYVEATAAIVEAARSYIDTYDDISGGVAVWKISMHEHFKKLDAAVRAYRAKGKEQNQ